MSIHHDTRAQAIAAIAVMETPIPSLSHAQARAVVDAVLAVVAPQRTDLAEALRKRAEQATTVHARLALRDQILALFRDVA